MNHVQFVEFLEKTETTYKAKFITEDKYFPDDKEVRAIYRVTFRRNGLSKSFRFGTSINDTRLNKPPKAYDVLAYLTKNDPDTFELFCSEYGYEVASKQAYKTYKAVQIEYAKVYTLFSDVMDELNEIA